MTVSCVSQSFDLPIINTVFKYTLVVTAMSALDLPEPQWQEYLQLSAVQTRKHFEKHKDDPSFVWPTGPDVITPNRSVSPTGLLSPTPSDDEQPTAPPNRHPGPTTIITRSKASPETIFDELDGSGKRARRSTFQNKAAAIAKRHAQGRLGP